MTPEGRGSSPAGTPGEADGRKTILVAANASGNRQVLAEFLDRHGYQALPAATPDEMAAAAAGSEAPAAAIVDISGFDVSVWERCRDLRERGIPFIVIAPRDSAASRTAGIAGGARDVLGKPVVGSELIETIRVLVEDG